MRTRLVVGLSVATLGLTTLFACSSSAPPYQEVSEYCTAYAKAICSVSTTCGFDPGPCQTYQDAQCNAAAQAAVASGTRTYRPQNVPGCITAVTNAYSGATSVSAATIAAYTATCNHVFAGSAGEGAACGSDFDCTVSGDVCSAAPGLGLTCAKPTPKALNDVCADPGDQCPSNAYCAPQNGTSRCVPAQTSGQPCSATQPCDGTSHCVSGACAALGIQSAPCTTSADCISSLFCDTFTSAAAPEPQCEPALQFGGRGSVDCLGIEGQAGNGASSSGGSSSGGSSGSSSGGGDAGGSDASGE